MAGEKDKGVAKSTVGGRSEAAKHGREMERMRQKGVGMTFEGMGALYAQKHVADYEEALGDYNSKKGDIIAFNKLRAAALKEMEDPDFDPGFAEDYIAALEKKNEAEASYQELQRCWSQLSQGQRTAQTGKGQKLPEKVERDPAFVKADAARDKIKWYKQLGYGIGGAFMTLLGVLGRLLTGDQSTGTLQLHSSGRALLYNAGVGSMETMVDQCVNPSLWSRSSKAMAERADAAIGAASVAFDSTVVSIESDLAPGSTGASAEASRTSSASLSERRRDSSLSFFDLLRSAPRAVAATPKPSEEKGWTAEKPGPEETGVLGYLIKQGTEGQEPKVWKVERSMDGVVTYQPSNERDKMSDQPPKGCPEALLEKFGVPAASSQRRQEM